MKIGNKIRQWVGWLVLGLGLSCVQPAKAQYTGFESVFQFAVYYNGLMEFTDCAPLVINGSVQCNSNIYVGCPSTSSTLTFNGIVTASGVITNPAWFGYPQSSYIATNIKFNATPSPGYSTGAPVINLPFGTNSYYEMINLPNASDSPTNALSWQRYYYKADLVILVTNTTPTNVVTTVMMKNSMFDAAPLVYSITNNTPTTNAAYSAWNNAGFSNWLTTNSSFWDDRQLVTNHVTQIDVGKFGTWITTNTNCLPKWNTTNPFNGIIYVADMRTTNAQNMDCVRLTNGQTIPTMGATNVNLGSGFTTNYSYNIPGLTVGTINPLYILGLYNCPGTNNVSSTNTVGTAPCAVVCDALTILSPSWQDNNSWANVVNQSNSIPTAASDTVNTAIIAGNVPSTGSAAAQYSGGVHNLPRLLENWSNCTNWLNTSIVCLYPSVQATRQFEAPGNYYDAPARKYYYDQNFTNFAQLPPGTPQFYNIPATIVFTNLNQAYTGGYLIPGGYTLPYGPDIILNFPTLPSGVYPRFPGVYPFTATIYSPVYVGYATNVFIISQATAGMTVNGLSQTYSGAGIAVSVTTAPAGLDVSVSYDGSTNLPVDAGSYTVVATVDDTNYQGSVTNTLVIESAFASVTLSNLAQVYTGAAEGVAVTTSPAGLGYTVTYNGSTNAPTNSGSYTVVVTVVDPNYQGGATNTLVISPPAPGPITVTGTTTLADGTFQLSFTNTPGAIFSVLASPDPTVPLTNWPVVGSVVEVSPGQFEFTDLDATNNPQQFYVITSP